MTRNALTPAFWVVTVLGAALIYLLPLAAMLVDARSELGTLYALVPLLITNPLITLVVTFLVARTHGAWVFLSLALIVGAFLASVFLVYNSSALIYLAFIAGGALLGWLLAFLTRDRTA